MTPIRVRWAGLAPVLLGLLLAGAMPAAAQSTGTITGRVVDAASQQALAGAQVSVVGTTHGGLANASGTYLILNVPAGMHTVRVQMIGRVMQERQVTVSAGQASSVDFSLSVSAIALDEVVVTGTSGAGQTRRTLGNSISSVKAAELTEVAPIADVRQLLQGRTPGVTLTNSTGVVGGGSRMRIRGSGSLNAGNEPVVFVDGIRVQSGQSRTESNTAQPINLLDAFNPNDIESIEVIKGPAAATLYGAEAAAGVVQIITKKGRATEGLKWSANLEYGQVDWAPENQISTYWICNDARMDNLTANPGCGAFTKDMPLDQRILVDHPLDPSRRSVGVKHQYQQKGWTEDYPCLYPQQEPCTPNPIRTSETRSMNLSVRGGGEAYNFYLSGEKSDQDGTFYNNYSNRTGGRANFGFTPSARFNFSTSIGYAQLDQQLPQSDNSSNSILRNAYRGQAGGPAGQYLPGWRNYHPEFSNKYARHIEQERLTMALTGQYRPFTWWTNKLTVGLDRRESQNISGNQIDQTGGILYSGNSAGGSTNISTSKVWLWSVDYSGTLTRDLNVDWNSTLSAGMQLTRRQSESYGISGTGFVANSMNLVSLAAERSASQGFSEQTGLGFYMQEQMGWRNRVFATGAVRFDDNSAFGNEFSIVVYPKASLAWVISDEEFFDVSWVDQLKLRTAWGRAGNAPSPFSADRTYSAGRAVIGDQAINVLSTGAYGNANLRAETGDEIELGLEGSILGGKVGLDFTMYDKTTRDALVSVNAPPSSGWTGNYMMNVGEINNKGLELAVTTTPYRSTSVVWDVVASMSATANKLVSFGKDVHGNPALTEITMGDFLSVQRHREGYALGGYWATDVQRDANGRPILGSDGVALLQSCDSWEPDQRASCQEEYLGSPYPTRQLGLTNTIQLFENLQLYLFMDYQGGHYQWCAICSVRTRSDLNTREINDPRLDSSHPEYAEWGRYELGLLKSAQTKRYLYPADFIKLRELSATYTLPRRLSSRVGFSRASMTLSGRNLWIWTKYEGNADPEVAFTGDASFTTSDYGSIPMQRRWSLGLNLNF